jgi:hypothetical protein
VTHSAAAIAFPPRSSQGALTFQQLSHQPKGRSGKNRGSAACRPKVGAGFAGEAGTASPEESEYAKKTKRKSASSG